MSKAKTDDNFLAQILDAEIKATGSVEKAKAKAHTDLDAFTKKAKNARADKLEKLRDKAKDKLKERQVKARSMYEDMVQEGTKEASMLEKEIDRKIDKQIPMAQAYFVSDILA